MFISFEQENVAIVEFGAKTQVLHSLSTDYPSIRRKIGKCSEFMFVSVNILGNVLDSFPSSSLFYVTYSVCSVGCC